MKALSIKQPWAWAIIYAGKPVENRSWATRYRGPIVIHASKTFDHEGYKWIAQNEDILGCKLPHWHEIRTGGIVGKASIVDCVRSHSSNWFFGPWGYVLEGPEPLEFVPYRGQLGFFEIDQDNLIAIPGPGPEQLNLF